MNPKLLLCLALVLSGGIFGCSSALNRPAAAAQSTHSQALPIKATWQITLQAAVTNGDLLLPVMAGWRYFYTVPADAAKILESKPPAELLPFLAKLRVEPPAWKMEEVDTWITIVRNGLHGKPSVITNSVTSANGNAVFKKEIPVYIYSFPIGQPNHKTP